MIDNDELIYQIALSRVKGLGFSNWKSIIEIVKSAENVYKLNKKELT